jgi:hypothetical protein
VARVLGLEDLNSTFYGVKNPFDSIILAKKPIKFPPGCFCVEALKLLSISWVAFVFAGLLVPQSICSSWDHFGDVVRS